MVRKLLLAAFGLIMALQCNAQTSARRVPYAGQTVQVVDFFNDELGLAAGNGGELFRTTDGGQTWLGIIPGSAFTILGIDFASENVVYVVGSGGIINKSTNGGLTFVSQTSGVANQLNDVFFLNEDFGYAVGNNGVIRLTTNGGTNWNTVTSGVATTLSSTHWFSPSVGLVVGASNQVRRTTNGGASWTNVTPFGSGAITSVSFSGSNGLIVAGANNVRVSTNSGASWTTPTGITGFTFVSALAASNSTFYITTSAGGVRVSTNGGSTFNLVAGSTGSTTSIRAIAAPSVNTLYVGAALPTSTSLSPALVKSTNGGSSFSTVLEGSSNTLTEVSVPLRGNSIFGRTQVAYAVGLGGQVLKSTNFGRNWTSLTTGVTDSLLSVFFVSPDTGWVVGAQSRILFTTNGGSSFVTQTAPVSGIQIRDIAATSANNAICVGRSNQVWRWNGTVWSALTSGLAATQNFQFVNYQANSNNRFTIGGFPAATALLTTNNGTSFSSLSPGNGATTITDLYFFNNTTALSIASGGNQIRGTTNGGTTWVNGAGGTTYLDSEFPSLTSGIAVLNNGFRYQTARATNGGITFTAGTLNLTTQLNGVTYPFPSFALMVGSNGSILELIPAAPTITSLSVSSGAVGSTFLVNGTNLGAAVNVSFAGVAATFRVLTDNQLQVVVPVGATSTAVTVETKGGTVNSSTIFSVTGVSNLYIANAQTISSGTYNNITIVDGGTLTLGGNIVVNGALGINGGGRLNTATFNVSGTGSIGLGRGNATLSVGSPDGISSGTSVGAIRLSGARTLEDGIIEYNGVAGQVTGNGMPTTLFGLIINNTAGVTLSQATTITGSLRLYGGVFNLNSLGLALGYTPQFGTASLDRVRSGAGLSNASNFVFTRFITPSNVTSVLSKWYFIGTPIQGQTLANLMQNVPLAGFPGATGIGSTNLFFHNEANTPAAQWVAPTNVTNAFTSGRGVRVFLRSSFNGTYRSTGAPNIGNGGDLVNTGGTEAFNFSPTFTPAGTSGFNLVANPFPATIHWDAPSGWTRTNMDSTVYVWDAVNGVYKTYDANTNIASHTDFAGRIASGQAFFAKARAASPVLTATEFVKDSGSTKFFRRAAQPMVRMSLTLTTGEKDQAVVADMANTTTAFESGKDVEKLFGNFGLGFVSQDDKALAIAAVDAKQTQVVDLALDFAGSATLSASRLNGFEKSVYLLDKATGEVHSLNGEDTFTFTNEPAAGRYAIIVGEPSQASQLVKPSISVYPNPASSQLNVAIFGATTPIEGTVTITNTLGQVVATAQLASVSTAINVNTLTGGLYNISVYANGVNYKTQLVKE